MVRLLPDRLCQWGARRLVAGSVSFSREFMRERRPGHAARPRDEKRVLLQRLERRIACSKGTYRPGFQYRQISVWLAIAAHR